MILKISKTLMAAVPSENKPKWIREKVGERLREALPDISYPLHGGRASLHVDKPTSEHLSSLSLESGRRPNEIFTSCLIDVLEHGAPQDSLKIVPLGLMEPEPEATKQPKAPARAPRKISKARQAWLDGLEERRTIIRADIAVGRWGRFSITGGNPAVKPDEPLDPQGVRDFDGEIQQGVVVQEIIPWEYSEAEAAEWLKKRHQEGKPLSWYYISGDSESLNDVQESRRRGELRADKRFPEMVEALARLEHEEALEREAFGRKRYYLDWSVRDRDRLLQIAARDEIPEGKAIPKNLMRLAEKAASPAALRLRRMLEISGPKPEA